MHSIWNRQSLRWRNFLHLKDIRMYFNCTLYHFKKWELNRSVPQKSRNSENALRFCDIQNTIRPSLLLTNFTQDPNFEGSFNFCSLSALNSAFQPGFSTLCLYGLLQILGENIVCKLDSTKKQAFEIWILFMDRSTRISFPKTAVWKSNDAEPFAHEKFA